MYEKLIDLAVGAALKAGKAIVLIRTGNGYRIREKADSSPVTDADMEAHRLISRFLEKTGLPILSEEGGNIPWEERKSWKRYWLVDPLDGTKEFISGNGDFTVNIALMENNRSLAGVVFTPVTGELYYNYPGKHYVFSREGGGTGADEQQGLKQERAGEPGNPMVHRPLRVVASRSHRNPSTETYIGLLKQEHPDLKIVSRGSSLKFCMMASGEADLYPRLGPTMEWDTAAGQAIAESAGCRVLRLADHRVLEYNKPDLTNPWFVVTPPC